jgi:hypothetical protein
MHRQQFQGRINTTKQTREMQVSAKLKSSKQVLRN